MGDRAHYKCRIGVTPTDCRCGGDLAFVIEHPSIDEDGVRRSMTMVGCVCHTHPDRLVEWLDKVEREMDEERAWFDGWRAKYARLQAAKMPKAPDG